MLPTQSVCGSVQPLLPMPRFIHQPMEPIFTRPRQLMFDFPPPLVPQIPTYSSNHVSCKDTNLIQPRPSVDDQLSTGQQNLQQELQCKSNPHSFIQLNQEVKNPPSKPLEPLPEHVKINGSKMSMGSSATNCQPNGPAGNARIPGENLMPALDAYSFHNRLCELFPDIHPPQLQRVFDECGRDFLRTVDNVLYARRLRKSIMAQMSKFRSQQRNPPPSNFGQNSQQQKDQEAVNHSQVQGSRLSKSEKQPRQSPKSYPNAKSATNVTTKRSRILAYQPMSTPSVHSSRRGCSTSTKCNQTTQGPASSLQQCMGKCSPPPPNVFVHQIDMGQQAGGSGDATVCRKVNQNYIFSYKRPMTNTYGTLPQPSSHMNIPVSSCRDFNSILTPLPPFCAPQQFTFPDSYPRVPGRLEPHIPLETTQQLQEQNQQQNMNDERISQQPNEQCHLPDERNLEAPEQSNETESVEWTLLLKDILNPMHSIDSNSSNGMINTQKMEAHEMYGTINQKKQGSGNFIFKANGPPGFSFVSDSHRKHPNEDGDIAPAEDTKHTHQAIKLGNVSVHGSLSEQINVTDLNRNKESGMGSCNINGQLNSSPSGIRSGPRQSLVFQCDKNMIEQVNQSAEGTSGIQLHDRDENTNEPDLSPANQLVIDTDTWTPAVDHEEHVNSTEHASQSDDDRYAHILDI